MEWLKNLIWLVVGGVVLMMLMGVSPDRIKATVNDLSDLVQQEVANTGRSPSGHHDPSNGGHWVNNDYESVAASRPYSGR